ncbi:hypothetical protein SmJEL517_g02110 [Synchytrium microbalum]|uniref:Major facilitator superfamily (MFS) profile domain-containing protein n=1 Tax=Synchytrium microbalum TaxID=1806994 RepID=A0A507CBX0_9FUNG|nr:uncharacterized protein SmJEL517_g02110 [Synchytrium microbalum]TPX35506.1 hypothetical protein SmJEL517_g02110 [Synchytrium microbalum]
MESNRAAATSPLRNQYHYIEEDDEHDDEQPHFSNHQQYHDEQQYEEPSSPKSFHSEENFTVKKDGRPVENGEYLPESVRLPNASVYSQAPIPDTSRDSSEFFTHNPERFDVDEYLRSKVKMQSYTPHDNYYRDYNPFQPLDKGKGPYVEHDVYHPIQDPIVVAKVDNVPPRTMSNDYGQREMSQRRGPEYSDHIEPDHIEQNGWHSERVKLNSYEETDEAPKPKSKALILLLVFSLALTILMAALDSTIVATALPIIASQLGDLTQLPWVATSYLLTSTVSLPIFGKLSDVFGRKIILLISIAIFLVGSALCGASQNMIMLIVFRAVQGLGGGGLMSLVMITLSELVSLRERGLYQGLLTGVMAIALLGGPIFGGLFTDKLSWRWAFYINLVIGVFPVTLIVLFLHLPVRQERVLKKLRRIDYLGAFILIAFSVFFLLGLQWGGQDYAWNSQEVIGVLACGVVFFCLFIVVEWRWAAEPIIPMRLFGIWNYVLSSITCFTCGFAFYSSAYYLPYYFQVAKDVSATTSGLYMFPLMIGYLLSSIFAGVLAMRTGRYTEYPKLCALMATFGSYLISRWDGNSGLGEILGFGLIFGIAAGGITQPMLLVAQACIRPSDLATGTSANSFIRTFGGVLGLAVMGSILNNVWRTSLLNSIDAQSLSTISVGNSFDIEVIKSLPDATRLVVVQAFIDGHRTIWWTSACVCALGYLACMMIVHIPLRKTTEAVVAE